MGEVTSEVDKKACDGILGGGGGGVAALDLVYNLILGGGVCLLYFSYRFWSGLKLL